MAKRINTVDPRFVRAELERGRRGLAFGANDEAAASVDAKNVPLGRVGKGSQIIVRLRLGTTVVQEGATNARPYIDLLSRGLWASGSTPGQCGIKHPAAIDYWRLVHYLEASPARVKGLLVQATDAGVIADTEIAITRRTPWTDNEDERIPLSSFLDNKAFQTNMVTVPMNNELDGATFLRVYHGLYATADKELTLTFAIEQIAERRAALKGA